MKIFVRSSILLGLLVLFIGRLSAQQATRLSLAEAIDHALKHNTEVLNADIGMKKAVAQKNEVRGIGLPQIDASFDVKNYVKLPTSLVPAEFFGGQPGEFAEVQFGTKYNATAGISASQLLFSGDYIVALQSSGTYIRLSEENARKTRNDVAVDIAKYYYGVLINQERYSLLQDNLNRLERIKSDTEKMYRAGFAEKVDFDRITVTYNNLKVETDNLSKLLNLGYTMLKFQMGMSLSEPIELTDTLNDELIQGLNTSIDNFSYESRMDYNMLLTQIELSKQNLKRYRYGYLPNVVLYGSMSAQAQRNELNLFSSDEKWFPINLVGLTVNWNLFDGLQRNYRIRQAEYDVYTNENNLANVKKGIDLEVENTKTILENSLASMENQKANMSLAEEILNVTEKKYAAGTTGSMDVIQAEGDLREAQTNYFNALYNAIVAKIDFDKAIGKISYEQ